MAAKIFLAIYTVQSEWDKDPIDTLKKAKALGYDGVEAPILEGDEADVESLAAKMNDLSLTAMGPHVNFDQLCENTQLYISRLKKFGLKTVGIPWLDRDRLPGGARYADTKLKILGLLEKCLAAGITLFYHNHNFEFEKLNGVCKEDIFLQDIPGLAAQLDVCWCTVGGQDPAAYIRHYGHRMPSIHLKDFTASGNFIGEKLFDLLGNNDAAEADRTRKESGFDFKPVGYGKVDFPSIFKAIEEVGIPWAGVEQDASTERPAFEAAAMSIDYIRRQIS